MDSDFANHCYVLQTQGEVLGMEVVVAVVAGMEGADMGVAVVVDTEEAGMQQITLVEAT